VNALNVLETEWWTLAVPPEWWAESEADTVLIGDHDDVGCIEISTLHKDEGDFSLSVVSSIAAEDDDGDWSETSVGELSGLMRGEVDDDVWLREWYVFHGSMLLYMTYSCDLDNRGMDDAAVDEILDTLMVVSAEIADA
jgi:hypothetical protein